MANYHLEVQAISRRKGRSVTRLASYITGRKLRDNYNGKTYYHRRDDILYGRIFQPANVPPEFYDLQHLCDAIEGAEKRKDSRTAREFKGSLPNELSLLQLVHIVFNFASDNFLSYGLCAIAAIHEGKNVDDPTRNNPHVHIIVPTRTVGPDGFNKMKDREHDKYEYIGFWREQWAFVQNRAYEQRGLDIRVSHKSLEAQGIHDREPTIHLNFADFQREKRGERTPAGDRKREIEARNRERTHQRDLDKDRTLGIELSR